MPYPQRGVSPLRAFAYTFVLVWLAVGVYHVGKSMPEGTDIVSAPAVIDASRVTFLIDRTYDDLQGRSHRDQQVFDAVFDAIDHAETFVVADFFLFNDQIGDLASVQRRLSSELAQHLAARKLVRPDLTVVLITDPINEVYGGQHSATLDILRKAGVDVVLTDLSRLRDSNPAYSAFWRMAVQWFGNSPDGGILPNPFGGPGVTIRSWLALLNFKANHRKVVIADREDGNVTAIVTSANPHDASSAHSNVGMKVEGDIARNVLSSELAIARFSGWRGNFTWNMSLAAPQTPTDPVQLTYLTEESIRTHLIDKITGARNGDAVRIAMFYLSDRSIVTALLAAAARGADVKLILDPNKDAFGHQKDGVPNRPVANELVTASDGRIQVRWYRTHGEQFHTKLALITQGNTLIASLGSANFTRRNLGNYNLEANLASEMSLHSPLARQLVTYFDELWSNTSAHLKEPQFTAPFGAYEDSDTGRYWRYRLMEATGLSTF